MKRVYRLWLEFVAAIVLAIVGALCLSLALPDRTYGASVGAVGEIGHMMGTQGNGTPPAPTNRILTEAGQPLATESGTALALE